jgi:hypothetical protein
MTDEELLVKQLHELADWVEKNNGVHCHSVPRKAAYTITRLQDENEIYRLQLNKNNLTIIDVINRYIGIVRVFLYKLQNRRKRVKR